MAPVQSLYVFSATVMAEGDNHNTHFELTVNGTSMTLLYMGNSVYDQVRKMSVLALKKGDDVVIRSRDAGGMIHGEHPIFAGFLLKQKYSQDPIVGK